MCEERGEDGITLIDNHCKTIIPITLKKSADWISYPESAQSPGQFAITDSLFYFRHPRTDPAEEGAGLGRWSGDPAGLQGSTCYVPG